MEEEHTSFVGLHPTPVVYGMTIGEYGRMINGEGWLDNEISCDLQVIPVSNYDHDTEYILPIPPSPNLPKSVQVEELINNSKYMDTPTWMALLPLLLYP